MFLTQNKSSADFTHYPLLWLAICFAAGILTACFLVFDWKIYVAFCALFAILAVVFLKKNNLGLIFISVAFIAAGAVCFQSEKQSIAENRLKILYDENQINSDDPIELEGILQSKPELATDGFFLTLKTEKAMYKGAGVNVSGNVRFFALVPNDQIAEEYEQLNLQYGSRVRVACRPRRAENFLNPGVRSIKEILDRQNIDVTASVKSPLLIEKIKDENVFMPIAWIYERRQNLIVDFKENFNRPTAGILIASLLGSRYFLDKQTAEVFREGGTFHILVISGLHITFIGGLTLLLLRFFTNKRFWQFVIAVAFLWAYSLAVGADVPVVRATLMFTILLFSQLIFRNGNLLNALGACALILLVWRPADLFNPSFQLTFVSVAAIVAFAFPLIENLRAIGSWSPSAETPFPPNVPVWLRRFCEMLYWRGRVAEIENKRQIWSANLFKSPYLKWLEAKGGQAILRYVFEAFLVSFIVQIWLLPLLAVYFHRLSMAAVLLNLWVGIFIALKSFAAFFALLAVQISKFLALPLIRLTEILNWLLLALPKVFIANDWASIRLPVYSGEMKAIYFVYFAPLLVLAVLLNNWNPFEISPKSKVQSSKSENLQSSRGRFSISLRFMAIGFWVLCFTTIVFHPFSAPPPDGRLRVDFLDVGQGDAAFVTFPNGETLLIDGGGKVNYNRRNEENDEQTEIFEPDTQTIGEAVVSEFIWEKGYAKIDYILASHADADHIQGLNDAAKNFRVRAAFFGITPENDNDFAALAEILRRREIEIVELAQGDEFSIGGVKIEVLYPQKDESPQAVSDNNNSLVLRLSFGARSFLMTGDIERETENELMKTPELLKTDVIKVAHHGSRSSSIEDFVRAAEAKIAVISVGKVSPFGHPHPEIVERWQNSGAKVITTGERGAVSISTDGKDLTIKQFK